MTRPVPGGRRRVDRVLDPQFVTGLAALPLDEVRRRRDEADQEEADLSYLRRLLHGRMDLLRAEQRRRAAGGVPGGTARGAVETGDAEADLRAFVARLAEDLTSDAVAAAPTGLGRHLRAEPTRVGERRRAPEVAWSDPALSDPGGVDDAALAAALERLTVLEAEVSEVRRAVQDVADALSAELGRRYRDGEAQVDDLLRPAAPDAG